MSHIFFKCKFDQIANYTQLEIQNYLKYYKNIESVQLYVFLITCDLDGSFFMKFYTTHDQYYIMIARLNIK